MVGLGKLLIVVGVVIAVIGLFLLVGASIPGVDRLGRLPGDIYIRRGNFTFYFPLATSIVLSIVLTIILMLLRR